MRDDELRFSGENRKRDLRRLKRAYDEVAASAEALANGRTVNGPAHRVVLIEAERGLGKTRLAMELYRHLSTSCDPDQYWPDTYGRIGETVHVMPKAEAFDYRRQLPFLWWGLGVAPGAGVGSTTVGSLTDLLPHLVSARIASQRRQSGREVVTEIADLAAEFGLPIVEGALDVAGLGTIKTLGLASFKIGRALKRGRDDQVPSIEGSRAPLESLTDTVIDDLGSLFAPGTRRFAGIPLVVLVDDAQFSADDTAVASLVERLIAQSARERWPLLLILTHWGRQMGEWIDGRGQRHQPSAVARVLNHARSGYGDEPGPAAKQIGGSLNETTFLRLDLSEPVDALDDALRDRFPGLSVQDIGPITDRSGGNPRKLEQIIARMERKPRWFEDGNLDKALTASGREAILDLADLPILDVVMDRFADTPPEVRQATLLASLMGNRFVCDLVDRLAASQFDAEARAGLEASERSYRFLRDVADRARSDVAAFNEQLFWEAAKEYRESGQATSQLSGWPDDAALFAALDRLIESLLREPEAFATLNLEDHVEALSLASVRMNGAQSSLAGLALARLVSVENERGNPEGAYDAAQQFIDGFQE